MRWDTRVGGREQQGDRKTSAFMTLDQEEHADVADEECA
jgi:hypothetical protein